jgi:tetratricopeptide (TPR) repeat protein
MQRERLKDFKKILRKDHSFTLSCIHYLISVFQNQRKYEKAEKIYRKELKRFKKMLEKNYFPTFRNIAYLISTFQNQGKYEKTEKL